MRPDYDDVERWADGSMMTQADWDEIELPPPTGITCDHRIAEGSEGICDSCLAEYRVDPEAWVEFGQHPQGRINREAQDAEMAAMMAETPERCPDDDIPF